MSTAISDRFNNPTHLREVANATSAGTAGVPGEGPYLTMKLRTEAGIVLDAGFATYGCPVAIACGDWVASWTVGRNVADLAALEPRDVELVLGGVPLGKEHCAALAVQALRTCLTAEAERRQ